MKKRFWYCLLVNLIFIGIYPIFAYQQSYAQSPTPSSVPAETPTSSPASPTITITSPSLGATVALPAAVEDSNSSTVLGTPTASPPTQSISPLSQEDTFGFDFLGFGERQLSGSTDSAASFKFGLPADWRLEEGAEIQLNLSTFFNYLGLQPSTDDLALTSGGSLEILFNDVTLTTLPLDEIGEQSITIPITTAALVPSSNDGRHELKLNLDSGLECGSALQTSVIVHPTSHFVLPHHLVTPPTDLRLLPQPIYQRSFLPDLATIVLPNQPTAAEMQAALAVAAGFGKMTSGNMALPLTPVGRLTAAVRETNHLIFVGNAKDFPLLKEATLPAPIGESGFEAVGTFPEDGIIQMVVSPWNPSKVILIVGGESDIGVIKAGQAISSGNLRTSGQPDLALIAEIQLEDSTNAIPAIDQTLADLGYSYRKLTIGGNTSEYEFEVLPGYIVETDGYLDLTFNHSALLDYEQSGAIVTLNGQPVGSVRFSDESTSLSTTRLVIPRLAIRTGTNKLALKAGLEPQAECYNPQLESVWLTIWPQSLLHLPLKPVQDEVRAAFDLNDYPKPFDSNSTLNDVAFVLAANNPTARNIAAQIAFDLGDRVKPELAEFVVVYGEAVPENIRQNYHLLVIGRPSQIPLMAELNNALPAPFEPGSDIAVERSMRVRPRILPDTSLGYLESFPAPWNRSRTIMAMLGSTDQGVEWTGTALTTSHLRNQLKGNFAVIDNEHISVGDLQIDFDSQSQSENTISEDIIENTVPEDTPELETNNSSSESISETVVLAGQIPEIRPIDSEISSPVDRRPGWLLPTLVTSTSLMFVIVGVVVISSWRRHRLKH